MGSFHCFQDSFLLTLPKVHTELGKVAWLGINWKISSIKVILNYLETGISGYVLNASKGYDNLIIM